MASSSSSSSMVGLPVSTKPKPRPSPPPQSASFTSSTVFNSSMVSFCFGQTLTNGRLSSSSSTPLRKKKYSSPAAVSIVAASNTKPDPLRIMISGAPASGKGTQCELIVEKYGLMHIAAGDLLRAEVAAGTENGKQAKEFMEKGQLVPNEIVVMMVKDRLIKLESEGNGWLLDGYPRSSSQAAALEDVGIRPDLFILLNVPEEILVERVVGRRLDPVTGRIYHLKYAPPENDEIAARLTQRFDDTEEKVKLRLRTHHQNVEAVLSVYEDITIKVNGNVSKDEVFAQIDSSLSKLLDQKQSTSASMATGL